MIFSVKYCPFQLDQIKFQIQPVPGKYCVPTKVRVFYQTVSQIGTNMAIERAATGELYNVNLATRASYMADNDTLVIIFSNTTTPPPPPPAPVFSSDILFVFH